MEVNEFEVLDIRGFGIEDNLKIGRFEFYEVYCLVKVSFIDEVDVIFISCINWRIFEIIEVFEEDFGVLVVISN